jgi:hypothetical protein
MNEFKNFMKSIDRQTALVIGGATLLMLCFLMVMCSGPSKHDSYRYAPPTQQANPAPVAPTPVVIQQAPAQSSSTGDMLMGGALGYMLGSAGNNRAAPAPQVVERTVYVDRPVVNTPLPTAAAAPATKSVIGSAVNTPVAQAVAPKPALPTPAAAPKPVAVAPAPIQAAPKPAASFSAPSSYKAPSVSYSAPSRSYSAPSSSFSSGRR